ncbi:MAG: ATP-binding protein [Alphaproteobacteria bacterium]|nr:ATP-binding protein [Alphaproteobacteria bacterium]
MIDEKVILQVLEEQRDEVLNYDSNHWVKRGVESFFEFDSQLAQVVIGVRRSGKSTLCHKVLKEHGVTYAYVNFDDDRLVGMQTPELNTLLTCIYQIYGVDIQYIFFDEIQNVDGWHIFINRLLRANMRVFVTGSNAKLLSGELATHLTGRYNEIRLFPFSFAEYCSYHAIDTKSSTTKAEAIRRNAFVQYVNDGGFPEVQTLNNKRGYVQSLLDAVIQKDIQQRFRIRNVDILRKTSYQLISTPCQCVNYDDLSEILQVSDKTLRNYVDYLRQAFLVQLLPKFSFKSKERIVGEKSYLVDTGLENNRDYSMAAENLGWRLENVVYIELLRRCSNKYLDVYYYKPTTNSKEIDFVVCNQNNPQELIQVAYDISAPKTFNKETSALVDGAEKLNCNNLTLITIAPSRTVEVKGKIIKIQSAIDWLLNTTL